jgi:hypothetical protein
MPVPAASWRKIKSTPIRVPAMRGLPTSVSASVAMRGWFGTCGMGAS